MSDDVVDGKYYQVARPGTFAERLALVARDDIYADLMTKVGTTAQSTVLDVGVSDVISAAANVLERKYPHPAMITAVGLGAGAKFQAEFPHLTYRADRAEPALPFADGAFDLAVSNAVLEHVGSREHQAAFVDDLARVAGTVYISVPNRFFPIEHHTGIPFLHWTDVSFGAACRVLGKMEWTQAKTLILMTRSALDVLCAGPRARGRRIEVGTTGIGLGPFSSNLYALIT